MNCRLIAPTTLLLIVQLILLTACGTDRAAEGDWGDGPDVAPDVAAEESCTTAAECDDGNPCTEDLCASDGLCKHIALTDTVCDDGNQCTEEDRCDASGGCAGSLAVICDDGNSCTVDLCTPSAGCTHTGVVDGTACEDGDYCSVNDVCLNSECQAGTAVDCDDNQPADCLRPICNPLTGQCDKVEVREAGHPCYDGNACT